MTPLRRALKLLANLMFVLAFLLVLLDVVLFSLAQGVVAVVMAALVAACIVFDVMLGFLGRATAKDPHQPYGILGVIVTALVFNAVSVVWFAINGGMTLLVGINAFVVLLLAAVAHFVNREAQ